MGLNIKDHYAYHISDAFLSIEWDFLFSCRIKQGSTKRFFPDIFTLYVL
jgi:hypothetical protein